MVVNRNVPELILQNEKWDEERRKSILQAFEEEVYGCSPKDGFSVSWNIVKEEPFKNIGTKRVVEIYIDAPKGRHSFLLYVFIPKTASQHNPVPVMLSISITPRFPQPSGMVNGKELDELLKVVGDRVETLPTPSELPKPEPYDLENNTNDEKWPVEVLLSKGYATAAFYAEDIGPDNETKYQEGIISYFEDNKEAPNSWGTIAAWAFGASRAIDYLTTDSLLDKSKISVIGHSRGGKTALWCAANDPRVYCCYANNSGCTGAALSRGKKGEDVFCINTIFPYWFCENYKKYNNREDTLPVDQHMLLASIAPRLLYLASASEDLWADPESEFYSAVLASEVYEYYGLRGLEKKSPLKPGQKTHKGRIGYHVRKGRHELTLHDWELFCEFLESKR
ncbi:alpha/beta hydrolase family protein [Bacillus timonensis]|uniref:alpha/beta hydrolase family protein n=1 Tax=Bacillus timonensis TaxID=1033734 RepID=UPI00028809B5|nr:prolyl oligopeptidase family serine peptidase [Bacillus timonensis]